MGGIREESDSDAFLSSVVVVVLRSAMARDTKVVAAWDFDRLIPCHGDVVETGAKQVWLDAFKTYLEK
jgi:hypothetical protein